MSDSNPHESENASSPGNPIILPTQEQRLAEEERQQEQKRYESENAYKQRQIQAMEAANDLARSNRNLTKAVIILTAVTAVATWYQGLMNRRSWETAKSTLNQMSTDAAESAKQFQVQLGHYDAGLGRTGLLAIHAGEQSASANKIATLTAKQFDQNQRLVESQRASIDVSFLRVLNPITFSEIGEMSEAFSIAFKNNGSLPANLTAVRYKVIFVQWGDDMSRSPERKQAELCDKPPTHDELRSIITPITIYKDTALEWQINFGVGKPIDSEIIKWPPQETVQTLRIYPMVVGCIDYQSGAMANSHQTGFIFTLQRAGQDPGMPTLINLGVNVSRENVVVTRYFFNQGKSY